MIQEKIAPTRSEYSSPKADRKIVTTHPQWHNIVTHPGIALAEARLIVEFW